jgi:hypothetical protein
MSINKSLAILAFSLFFANKITAQDSTKVQDPLPVVITQEGYTGPQAEAQDIPLKDLTFKQRLKYGGSFGPFAFSSNQSIIGLSPMLGYQLTNQTIVGVGGSIIFWRTRDPLTRKKEKTDLIGYSAYIRQDIPFMQKINFPLYATIEALQFQGLQIKEKFKPALLVGLGMGNSGGYGLQVLYDLNYEYLRSFSGSFNDSPLVIRVTGFFN